MSHWLFFMFLLSTSRTSGVDDCAALEGCATIWPFWASVVVVMDVDATSTHTPTLGDAEDPAVQSLTPPRGMLPPPPAGIVVVAVLVTVVGCTVTSVGPAEAWSAR